MDGIRTASPSQAQPQTPLKKAKQDGPWQGHEDDFLRKAISQHHGAQVLEPCRQSGASSGPITLKWSEISEVCFSHGCKRDAKQCRERWVNHLDPNISHGQQLTPEEAAQLMNCIAMYGKKWARIGREMRKPENQLKNYYYQQDKKQRNSRKHNGPRRESYASHHQDQESTRQYAMPQPNRLLPHPHARPSYSSEATDSQSRRTSIASTNPGLISDAGSPTESSPRSPYGSFPYAHHELPTSWSASKDNYPQSHYSAPMDRSQSDCTQLSSLSSPSSPYNRSSPSSYPISQHHSEGGYSYTGSRAQPQPKHSYPGAEYAHSQGPQYHGLSTPATQRAGPPTWQSVNYGQSRVDTPPQSPKFQDPTEYSRQDTPVGFYEKFYQGRQVSREEEYRQRFGVQQDTETLRPHHYQPEARGSYAHEQHPSRPQVPVPNATRPASSVMSIGNLLN